LNDSKCGTLFARLGKLLHTVVPTIDDETIAEPHKLFWNV